MSLKSFENNPPNPFFQLFPICPRCTSPWDHHRQYSHFPHWGKDYIRVVHNGTFAFCSQNCGLFLRTRYASLINYKFFYLTGTNDLSPQSSINLFSSVLTYYQSNLPPDHPPALAWQFDSSYHFLSCQLLSLYHQPTPPLYHLR